MKKGLRKSIYVMLLFLSALSSAQLSKMKLAPPKKPTIEYDRVDVKSVSMEKTDVEFVYKVDNPNSVGIDGVLADYELFLKGNSTATGKDMKFTIPANGKSELKIPLEINYAKVFNSAEELTKSIMGGAKTVHFKMDILFKINWNVLKFNIPISAEGELPLPEIKTTPKVNVKKKLKF